MPASPPAPLVLHHPPEKGLILPASTLHLIECPFNSLFHHPDYATISTFALPARRLPPTTHQGTPVPCLPIYLFRFALTYVAPPPPSVRFASWFITRILRLFGFPYLFRFFPSVRIGSTIYFPLASVLSLSDRFNHLK